MPSSSIPVPDRDAGSYASPRKTSSAEDFRRLNSKLKSDLEAERAKVRQILRDKSAEIKRIQENFEKDRQKAIELATKRLTTEHAADIKKVRENTAREKENELRQVLKFKEEEVKTLKQQVLDEKEKNRRAEEELRRVLADKGREGEDRSEIERKLRIEISSLKEQKHRLDEMYRTKVADDNEKAETIRRLKAEHEIELQKFIKESKRETIHSLHQRRLTEKALEEKAHELAFKDHLAKKLEAEKGDLQRRLSHNGDLELSLRRSTLHRMGSSHEFGSSDRLDESPLAKKDKERELKKRNAELQSTVENLEKKCAVLEKEASKSGYVKATFVAEEKIKKLKKRNSELVSIARQLEDKAKKLQEEKVQAKKLAEDLNNSNTNNANLDHVKKMYARQRAKDLAEHAKSVMSKEKELEDLRKQLSLQQSGQHLPKEKVEELQSIIRQSAKERLWLERQMSSTDASRTPSPMLSSGDFAAVDIRRKTEKLEAMEAENTRLKASIYQLQKAEAESEKLANELSDKEKENHRLVSELEDKRTRCSKLEHEREKFAAKCTMLQKKNVEMSKRMEELQEVEGQVSDLKGKLEVSDMKCSLLTEECNKMKIQLEELLRVKEDLKKMEEQKKIMEKEHLSSLEKLKEREEEIKQLHNIQEEANKAHEMAVTSLEDTVRSLEQKCSDTEQNNVNLKKQVEELRQLEEEHAEKMKTEGCHKSTQTALDSSFGRHDGGGIIYDHPRLEDFRSQLSKPSTSRPLNDTPPKPSAHVSPTKSSLQESKTDSLHATSAGQSSAKQSSVDDVKSSEEKPAGSDDILDVLHSRIDQLAASDSEDDIFAGEASIGEKSDVEEPDEDKVQKPDLDLDDLAKRITQVAVSDDTSSLSTRDMDDSDASLELASMAEGDLGDMEDNQPDSCASGDEQMENSTHEPIGVLNVRINEPASTEPASQQTSDASNNESNAKEETLDSRFPEADFNAVDPAIMEKLAVYIARYSYDPVQHSPNENPEMELAFQAGDYLYVFGDMDEDGYYLGELMSGQRGLVPSNFVEKVADESEMNLMMNGTGEENDDGIDSSDEEDAEDDECVSEDGETSAELVFPEESGERRMKPVRMLRFSGKLHRAFRLSMEHIPDVGLDDIQEDDENQREENIESEHEVDDEGGPRHVTVNQDGVISDETDSESFRVPSPKRLFLERRFTRSVLVSWKPADLPPEKVKGYGVYVNGDLRLMIEGGDETKALLDDIDAEETYRISVRTVTTNDEESSDRSAVVTIGRDANLAPSHVHVTCVTPTSAKIEWSPGNSLFFHEILVNGVLHKTVRAGIFQQTITNLEPDHMYKVHVRAKKSKKAVGNENEADITVDFLTAETEFRTEVGGFPDPPLDVKASLGHANSMELNWIPVTITDKGTSNGARVTGYKVYINGFPCTEVTSPTADCVTAVSWMVERAIKRSHSEILRVIVRTQSCEGESADSNEVELPVPMFNFKGNLSLKSKGTELKTAEWVSQSSMEDTDQHPSEESNSLNGASDTNEQRERSDSVRRFCRDENGQAVMVLVNGSHKEGAEESKTLAKPRTMGEPTVWRKEEADETQTTESFSKSDERGSENEDEEEVELCIPEVVDDHVTSIEKATEVKEPEVNAEEQVEDLDDVREEEKGEKEDIEGVDGEEAEVSDDELNFDDDDVLPIDDESPVQVRPQITKKESVMSETSDVDKEEELGSALDGAPSIPRVSPEGDEVQIPQKPYIRPLEYEESDFESESSEQDPLSIIQEEDEEDLSESVAFPSNLSQSYSASEGFETDDDVIDLLDEDGGQGESAAQGVTVRKISQTERPSAVSVEGKTSEDVGLGRYLTKTNENLKVDSSQNSPYRLLDNIELEDSDGGVLEEDGVQATYSDTEADRDEFERSLTPFDEHEQGDLANRGTDQDHANPEDVALEEQVPPGQGETTDGQVRVFLALYDYDPATMSPNPGAEDEELAFSEGDLIKVYGDKDEDGFYWGDLDGRVGYIPHNMVSEVPVEEYEAGGSATSPSLDITHQEVGQAPEQCSSQEPEVNASSLDSTLNEANAEENEFLDPRNSMKYQLAPRRMVALFDYDPQTLSPNPDSDVELKFKVGDVIYVYGDMDEDGFFTGELRGIRGLVPSNFLEDLSDPLEAQQDSTQEGSHASPVVSAEKYSSINGGTHHVTSEDTPKKKKGIFSKGKQMFKKIAKSHHSQNAKR